MALLPLLQAVASQVVGLDINDTNSRTLIVNLINRAAKEIYESTDLVGCLREQVFYSDMSDAYQITLPYYVHEVRGIRQFGQPYPLLMEQMTPRYTTMDWPGHKKNWREKYRTPLESSLSTASHLKFTLQNTMAQDVVINVSGSTPTTDRVSETVTITAGTLTASTSNLWTDFPGLKTIRKNIITTTNVVIQDDANTIIGHIPNCELEASNLLIQVINFLQNCGTGCTDTTPCDSSGTGCKTWEVLYKIKFVPFSGDYDEFPCEGYDEAIVWKARELFWADQPGQEDRATLAFNKCKQIIESKLADARKGIVVKMDFGRSKYSNLHYYDRRMITPLRLTQGIYPVFPACETGVMGM